METKPRKPAVRLKIGDVLRVPLEDGRFAYIRYVRLDSGGMVVQVSNRISRLPRGIEDIGDFSELLFPPVYLGLQYAVRELGWPRIGNLPIGGYSPPPFKKYFSDQRVTPPVPVFVAIWDGVSERPLGDEDKDLLPSLEPWAVLSPYLLERRIRLGYSDDFIKAYQVPGELPVELD